MKNVLVAAILMVVGTACHTASEPPNSHAGLSDKIKAPKLLEFRGETYRAGYSSTDAKRSIVEYFIAGEGPKAWRKMVALRLDSRGANSIQQVKALEQMVRKRHVNSKGGSPVSAKYERTNGHDAAIDFILTSRGQQEFNAFRYVDRANGVVSLHYSELVEVAKIASMPHAEAVAYLKAVRTNSVATLNALTIPEIESVP
jgi:hypothetical protein